MARFSRRHFAATALAALLIPQAGRAAATHKVNIRNMEFSPASLRIKAGDTVTWTNRDGAQHTATADDRAWDSGILKKGKSASVTFDTPGTYGYFCAVHPVMKGKITVT